MLSSLVGREGESRSLFSIVSVEIPVRGCLIGGYPFRASLFSGMLDAKAVEGKTDQSGRKKTAKLIAEGRKMGSDNGGGGWGDKGEESEQAYRNKLQGVGTAGGGPTAVDKMLRGGREGAEGDGGWDKQG